MKELLHKVAYLQGLADGLELEDSKEGRLIKEILSVLDLMTDYIGAIDDQVEDMEDYLESIDSDLADVEDEVFDVDDDEDYDMVDVECPNCHEQVCFDASILYDDDLIEVTCPNCGAVVFVNDEEDDEELEEDEEEE